MFGELFRAKVALSVIKKVQYASFAPSVLATPGQLTYFNMGYARKPFYWSLNKISFFLGKHPSGKVLDFDTFQTTRFSRDELQLYWSTFDYALRFSPPYTSCRSTVQNLFSSADIFWEHLGFLGLQNTTHLLRSHLWHS